MRLNATLNNISAILWRSVLVVGETGVPEKTTDLTQVIDKLYHICSIEYTSPSVIRIHNVSGDMHWLNNVVSSVIFYGSNSSGICYCLEIADLGEYSDN
jgi:hypothetical protein